jgi:PPOX class probable F420-dependent enzyme
MTPAEARRRFATGRVARLATVVPARAGKDTAPHLVPVVFAVDLTPAGDVVYSAVDAKPKRTTALQRLANVTANPAVALLVDHYDDRDWSALWWVRADGSGRVLDPDQGEARHAVTLLASRYPQHREEPPRGPVLAVDVERWSGWSSRVG